MVQIDFSRPLSTWIIKSASAVISTQKGLRFFPSGFLPPMPRLGWSFVAKINSLLQLLRSPAPAGGNNHNRGSLCSLLETWEKVDHYKVLGVSSSVSDKELRNAYRKACLRTLGKHALRVQECWFLGRFHTVFTQKRMNFGEVDFWRQIAISHGFPARYSWQVCKKSRNGLA